LVGLLTALSVAGCTVAGTPATVGSPSAGSVSATGSPMTAGPAAASGSAGSATSSGPAASPPFTITPSDQQTVRWGAEPKPGPGVTLQPDVVIVGGGGAAIRNATDDGLTYFLDPAAPRAADLTRGAVMFVTGRVVGRVLDVRRAGADLAVTIGPVTLTEIFRDIEIAGTAPVPLADPISYPAGTPFWAASQGSSDDAGPVGLRGSRSAPTSGGGPSADPPVPAGRRLPDLPSGPKLPALPGTGSLPSVPGRPSMPAPTAGELGKQVGSSGLRLIPVCCEGGIGTHFSYDRGGVRAFGDVQLQISRPTVDFTLRIKGGSLLEAGLQIGGAAGLKVAITAARKDTTAQVDEKVAIPLDFSVPLNAFGIPLSATVNQWVVVKTAFSAKTGVIAIAGEYALKAGLGFSYRSGSFSAAAPAALTVRQSINDTMDGLSLGPAGIVLSYQARFLVGVGAFGFTAGVYFGFTASLGVTRGSDAGVFAPGTGGTQRIVCRGTRLSLFVNYGVGYSIPAPVADVINLFLKVFHSTPIEGSGGVGSRARVFDRQTVTPDLKVCGGSV
jgi:hypothetical protein